MPRPRGIFIELKLRKAQDEETNTSTSAHDVLMKYYLRLIKQILSN
jgi:hypothetical protein